MRKDALSVLLPIAVIACWLAHTPARLGAG